MIAISSQRPQANCPPDIWAHQVRARASWEGKFDHIIYFGPEEAELAGPNVQFLPCAEKPRIKRLCQCAMMAPANWVCLINADVVLGANWPRVEPDLEKYQVLCAVSRRYELGPDGDPARAKLADWGLDFFAARPAIWSAIVPEVPERFQLGRILWDTWMLGAFMAHSRGNCADLTPARVIFHPRHGNRGDQHTEAFAHRYLDRVVWPGFQVGKEWKRQPAAQWRAQDGGGGRLL